MNLEQRVQALEQEVALLKAQIQSTLLDIHEHLLNQSYPVLRGEDPARPAAPAPTYSPPPAAPAPVPVPAAAPIQRFSLTDVDDDAEDTQEDMPELAVFRKLNAVEEAPKLRPSTTQELPKPKPSIPERDHRAEVVSAPRDAAPYDFMELESWVGEKVEKLGIKRTRELINLYARQERFSTQECELLMQFVDIYDDSVEKPAAARPPALPSKPTFNKTSTSTHASIVPQTRAVVDEIRKELRQKHAAAQTQQEVPQETLSEQQGLVLRLIAGILNAGDDTPPASTNGRNGRWGR